MLIKIDVVFIVNVSKLVNDVIVMVILFFFIINFILFFIEVVVKDGVFVILDMSINMLLILIFVEYKYIFILFKYCF